ncbi:MAG: M23 family metallopeptidase [Spirochaetota bacterium]
MSSSKYNLSTREKLVLAKESWKKKLQQLRNHGKTRISLLLIPHSQEKIARIEMSISMLAFFSLTSALILLFSFYYGIKLMFLQADHKNLYNTGNRNVAYFLEHRRNVEKLRKTIKKVKSQTNRLHQIIWGKKMHYDLFSFRLQNLQLAAMIPLEDAGQQQNSNMSLFSQTVSDIANLHKQLDDLKPRFENTLDYLETRESVYQSMPQGRPLAPGVGFISSLYGKRPDPFGLGEGEFHNGIDFAASYRTPIYATAPGTIAELKVAAGGLGKSIRVDHGYGIYTLYGHCYEFKVKEGQKVERGDLIGLMGATGKATGSHVHYEVHIGSDPAVNPKEFINFE